MLTILSQRDLAEAFLKVGHVDKAKALFQRVAMEGPQDVALQARASEVAAMEPPRDQPLDPVRLAETYFLYGYVEEARSTYMALLGENPGHSLAARRLEALVRVGELAAKAPAEGSAGASTPLGRADLLLAGRDVPMAIVSLAAILKTTPDVPLVVERMSKLLSLVGLEELTRRVVPPPPSPRVLPKAGWQPVPPVAKGGLNIPVAKGGLKMPVAKGGFEVKMPVVKGGLKVPVAKGGSEPINVTIKAGPPLPGSEEEADHLAKIGRFGAALKVLDVLIIRDPANQRLKAKQDSLLERLRDEMRSSASLPREAETIIAKEVRRPLEALPVAEGAGELVNRAEGHALAGRLSEALKLFERALELAPDDGKLREKVALLRFKVRDSSTGRVIRPETLAEMYCKQGLWGRAAKEYQKLRDKHPERVTYARRLDELEGQIREQEGVTVVERGKAPEEGVQAEGVQAEALPCTIVQGPEVIIRPAVFLSEEA